MTCLKVVTRMFEYWPTGSVRRESVYWPENTAYAQISLYLCAIWFEYDIQRMKVCATDHGHMTGSVYDLPV